MLIAMAGLPGSGKSTLAARLEERLGGVVLGKDPVRAALFPPPVLDYSAAQDEIAMSAIYRAARAILEADPRRVVILDGRTFLRPGQLEPALALASSLGARLRIIECVCADAVARERLEKDLAAGRHPARNRTFALYLSLKEDVEPIRLPHLVVDTGRLALEECVQRCLAYLGTADDVAEELGTG